MLPVFWELLMPMLATMNEEHPFPLMMPYQGYLIEGVLRESKEFRP